MITIKNDVKKQQKNFWNNCLFHPTDAVEDSWGRRILDRMSDDKSIQTVRIYTMFEDIVLMDENGKLTYDFRINDLRLDYLVEKGYDVILAYGMMPECIASNKNATSCESKNSTRYKGKLINVSVPKDYKLWEEVCYEYTKHIVERYGMDTVSRWRMQCFNEPDVTGFFMPDVDPEQVEVRVNAYFKLYEAFAEGISRVAKELKIGGPAVAAWKPDFLEAFLKLIKENNTKLDYISIHNYASTDPNAINKENKYFSVNSWIETQEIHMGVINKCGFGDTELVVDEWGMASHGYYNIEECPPFIARENEVFSSYYVKLIYKILEKGWKISKLLICLSGQHEMITDFSGFRNFFTLNFFAKPIYNAYVMTSKLHGGLVEAKSDNENVYVISTKKENNSYAVLLTYSSDNFEEDLPETEEEVVFDSDVKGKKATVYCIDKNTTNPYRLYERKAIRELSENDIKELREEGSLKPIEEYVVSENIKLNLTANSVYLILID